MAVTSDDVIRARQQTKALNRRLLHERRIAARTTDQGRLWLALAWLQAELSKLGNAEALRVTTTYARQLNRGETPTDDPEEAIA